VDIFRFVFLVVCLFFFCTIILFFAKMRVDNFDILLYIILQWDMTTMFIDNWQTQLRKGMLDIVIMNLLSHGPYHGYEMVRLLKKIQGLKMREGNVYPILARLEQDLLIESYTESSNDGPPRKYFKLTAAGGEILSQMNLHWDQMISSISHVKKGDFE